MNFNSILKPFGCITVTLNPFLSYGDFKLILRPLTDITDKEYEEINKYAFGGASVKEYWLGQFEKFEERPAFGQGKKNAVVSPVMIKNRVAAGLKLKHYTFAPEAFVFLLSKGIDLFGLIDAGLAKQDLINKTLFKRL